MSSKMFELNRAQLNLIAGGIGIGTGGHIAEIVIGKGGRTPILPDPFGGFGDGGWTIPGDLVQPLPILKPKPGFP